MINQFLIKKLGRSELGIKHDQKLNKLLEKVKIKKK